MTSDTRDLTSVSALGLRAVLREYRAAYEMAPHHDSGPRLSLVVRGYLIEWIADQAFLAGPGDVVSKPGWVLHANRFGAEPVVMLSIMPNTDAPRTPAAFDHALGQYGWLPTGRLSLALRALAVAMETRRAAAAHASAWTRIVSAINQDPPQRLPAAVERIPAACAHIEAEAGAGLRIRQVARAAGIHPVYLTRLFQAAVGCTPSEYLQRAKLAAAVSLLSRTQRTAADVALTAGFADQAHLCRTLRRRLGVTPSALQRQRRFTPVPPPNRVAG